MVVGPLLGEEVDGVAVVTAAVLVVGDNPMLVCQNRGPPDVLAPSLACHIYSIDSSQFYFANLFQVSQSSS